MMKYTFEYDLDPGSTFGVIADVTLSEGLTSLAAKNQF